MIIRKRGVSYIIFCVDTRDKHKVSRNPDWPPEFQKWKIVGMTQIILYGFDGKSWELNYT